MGKTMQLIFSVSQPSYQLWEGYKKPTYLSLVVPAQNGKNNSFKAPDILVRKDSVSPDNLVMRIAGYSAFDFSKNAAVKKVTETEEECRQAFTTHQAKHHLNFMRQLSGFVIDPYHPFSEVSPDGIISCDCCRKVVSEIKCPYTHRNISVEEAAKIDRDFCPDETLFASAWMNSFSAC